MTGIALVEKRELEERKEGLYSMSFKDPDGLTLEDLEFYFAHEKKPISYWPPRKEEIERIAYFAGAVHEGDDLPTVLDIGCGNGFLSYLIASTGRAKVIGIDPNGELREKTAYAHQNLRFEVGDAKEAAEKYGDGRIDMVFNSWMPKGINLTPNIRGIRPKIIAYVRDRQGSTGVPDYLYEEWSRKADGGKTVPQKDAVSYHPGEEYRRVYQWYGPNFWNAHRHFSPASPFEWSHGDNIIDIQIRRDIEIPGIPDIIVSEDEKYAWEKGLEGREWRAGKMRGIN